MTSSRLAELLKEKNELLAQREKLLADLQALDNRIGHVTSEYGRTYNEERPISKLPNELLHTILQIVKDHSDPSDDMGKRPENTFCAVCTQWRRATLSFGDMWNSFRTRHPSENAYHRLVACLERSGTFPLDLWFDFRPVGLLDLPDRFHLLRESMKHIHRWRSFTVLTEIDSPILFLSSHLAYTAAPLLEALTLLPYRPYDFEPSDGGIPITRAKATCLTRGTPKLTYLCLNDLSGSIFLPPLATITDLRLDMIEGIENSWLSWEMFLYILRLPSLDTLSIVGQHFRPPNPDLPLAVARIDMPSVRHLRYACLFGADFVDIILPNLHAPNLRTLTLKELTLPSIRSAWNMSQLQPFPQLKTLVLVDFEFYRHSFAQELCYLTSNISMLVFADGIGSWLQWALRLGRLNVPALWENVERVVLDVPQGTFLATSFKTYCRRHPKVKTVYIPEECRFNADELRAAAEEIQREESRRVEVVAFQIPQTIDPCIGAWPPGAKDNGGVEDPFWIDIARP